MNRLDARLLSSNPPDLLRMDEDVPVSNKEKGFGRYDARQREDGSLTGV